jgi:hypothetical protein
MPSSSMEAAGINAIVKGMKAREDAIINVLLFVTIFLIYSLYDGLTGISTKLAEGSNNLQLQNEGER